MITRNFLFFFFEVYASVSRAHGVYYLLSLGRAESLVALCNFFLQLGVYFCLLTIRLMLSTGFLKETLLFIRRCALASYFGKKTYKVSHYKA